MRRVLWHFCAAAVLSAAVGCSRGSSEDPLLGKWTNHHAVAKQAAIVSIEFLPQGVVTISTVDALAAVGWHPRTTTTGQYQIVAPNRLKITEELGSAVLDYHIDVTQLVLSGDGLAQLLGKAEPPQTLSKGGP